MEFREKALYTGLHPIKQLVDWGSATTAIILLWNHWFFEGIIVAILPSLIAAALIMRYANLDRYKNSPLGRYTAQHMGRKVGGVRIAGIIPMALGAWLHASWLVLVGVAIVLLAWASPSLIRRSRSEESKRTR